MSETRMFRQRNTFFLVDAAQGAFWAHMARITCPDRSWHASCFWWRC